MGLKESAYRTACAAPVRRALARLGRFVDVPELGAPLVPPRHPLLLAITIDTEGGYVDEGERRVWQGAAPLAFEGYVDGIRNVIDVLDRHRVKATFLVSPHGLSATGATRDQVERAILRIVREGHEIGLHLHPTSDRAISAELGRTFSMTSARALSEGDRRDLLATGKRLLEDSVGVTLTSFRWGNWALDPMSASAVAEAGFRVDSSAVPRLRDRRASRFDWSACRERAPWWIAPGLLEVPIATFRAGPFWLRADPLYGPLLDAALDVYRARAPRALAPFPFVLMTHSTEATYRDGSPTRALEDLDRFLGRALAMHDVRPICLRDLDRPA